MWGWKTNVSNIRVKDLNKRLKKPKYAIEYDISDFISFFHLMSPVD